MTRVVVGIAGGSASGKSTVAEGFRRALGVERTAALSHDAYYFDLSHLAPEERIHVNVDHPDSLETTLLIEHVQELSRGEAVEMPSYDYVSQTRAERGIVVRPAPIVVVEGMLTLHDPRLRALMDLKVFVDATEPERLARRLARDRVERGRSEEAVRSQHVERVEPMHRVFVEPTREHADILVAGGGHNVEAIKSLAELVSGMLDGSTGGA